VEPKVPNFRLALILGGARSGKSRYGLSLAAQFPLPRLFVATAEAGDEEMAARIAQHRQERGPDWETREAPVALPQALAEAQGKYGVILVDCLTLWLTNLMLRPDATEGRVESDCQGLLKVLEASATPVIFISNEVGWGIVPENPLARRFRDEAGWLHQRLAVLADLVVLVVVGLPLVIKVSNFWERS
jgi:adenosylcobinamide kinase/adenosylcobinamide-phosphate guanylyltransferase